MDMDIDMFYAQYEYQDLENKAFAIENDLPDDLLFLDLTPAPELIKKPEPIQAPQVILNSQDPYNEYHDPDVFQYIQQEEKLQHQQQQQLLHQFNQQQSNVQLQKEQYQNEVDANNITKSEKQITIPQFTQQKINSLAQRGQYQNHNGHVDVNNFVKTDNRVEIGQVNVGLGQGQLQQQKKPQQIIVQRQQITVQRQPLVVQRRQQPVVHQQQQQVMQNTIQGKSVPRSNHQKLQSQLAMMLHASQCLKREKEEKNNNQEFHCKVRYCPTLRNILAHMADCKNITKDCPVSHCYTLKQIRQHWLDCKSDACQICAPLKNRGNKSYSIARTNISNNSSTTSAPNIKQYVNIQRLSG